MVQSIACSSSVFWGYCCPLISLQFKSGGSQGADRLCRAGSQLKLGTGCLHSPMIFFLSQRAS